LNNLIEQDRRGVKSTISPLLGFKNFDCAAIRLAAVKHLHFIEFVRTGLPSVACASKTKSHLQ
jgi:transposase-like protein